MKKIKSFSSGPMADIAFLLLIFFLITTQFPKEEGVKALGYVVENTALGRALNQTLLTRPQLEVCAPAKVLSIKPDAAGMLLQLESGQGTAQLTAALVVLAEGGRSGLCQQLGIHQRQEQYGQTAVIAHVRFTKAHQNIAYERFTGKGPLAL